VNSFAGWQAGLLRQHPLHRLTTSPGLQVLQCGDPTGNRQRRPGYKFNDETYPTLTYGRGYWRWPTPARTPTAASSS